MSESKSWVVVADASVLVDALSSKGAIADRARSALEGRRLAAPEHLRIETFHLIHSRLLGRKINSTIAVEAIKDLAAVPLELLPTQLILRRMWELRDNLSGYDAAYVAAAEYLGVPLVTFDRRLASVPGQRCEVVVP